ncbi:hypothetical protein L9F63_026882, partial [Diploptera punctata]
NAVNYVAINMSWTPEHFSFENCWSQLNRHYTELFHKFSPISSNFSSELIHMNNIWTAGKNENGSCLQ